MEMLQIKEKLATIIEAGTGVNVSTLQPDVPLHEQLSFDSMQFIGLVARVEEECSIELPMSVLEVTTLGEFYECVEGALSGQSMN